MLGNSISQFIYALLIVSAFLIIASLAYSDLGVWAALGLVTAPLGVNAIVKVFRAKDRNSMNQLMVISARLHAWTGYAFSLGILFSGY